MARTRHACAPPTPPSPAGPGDGTCGAAHELIVKWMDRQEGLAVREADANAEEHAAILEDIAKDHEETRTTGHKVDQLAELVRPLVEAVKAADAKGTEANARIDWWRNRVSVFVGACVLAWVGLAAAASPPAPLVDVAQAVVSRHVSAQHSAHTTAADARRTP